MLTSEAKINYYRKTIYPFVYKLVDNYIDSRGDDQGIEIDHFSESDIAKFASILLAQDPIEFSEVIWNENLYSSLIAAVRTEDIEDKIIWAENTIASVIKHFRSEMQLTLEDVYQEMVTGIRESDAESLQVDEAILRSAHNE